MDEYGWAYAVGRIRVREKELLSGADMARIADTPDLSSALGALRDTYYGPYVAAISPHGYDGALERAMSDAYRFALSVSPEPTVVSAYRARNDYHNVKVWVKASALGESPPPEALSHLGNFDAKEMPSPGSSAPHDWRFRAMKIEPLSKALVGTFQDASALWDDGPESILAMKVDSLVDQRYYGWFHKATERFGYAGLKRFRKAEVDLLNLKMAVRAKKQSLPGELFGGAVLPGGSIEAPIVSGAYEEGPAALKGVYGATRWAGLAETGIGHVERGESLQGWERACDGALMGVIKESRYYAMGPEPVYGFLLAKETEVKNLRVILRGKESGAQDIAGRLRESYV